MTTRSLALSLVALALTASTARAEIRVIEVATGASTTLVADHRATPLRWTDDGAALLIRDRDGTIVQVGLDGRVTPQPHLAAAVAVGPGGRTIVVGDEPGEYELRAPDGRVVSTQRGPEFSFYPDVTWSEDGTRVAAAVPGRLVVLDTHTGAVLLRRARSVSMGEQAFAADGASLVVSDDDRVRRVDIPSGRATVLERPPPAEVLPVGAVSPTGKVAISHVLGPVRVLGSPSVRVAGDPLKPALWSPDGRTLSVPYYALGPDQCDLVYQGLGVVSPGQPLRVLIEPAEREVETARWSPDGTRLAVKVGPEWPPAKRGRRHAWPKRVAPDYEMTTRARNAAARRVILRAARALRDGESREAVINRVRLDYTRLEQRFREAKRTAVRAAVTAELDRWLRAAGFEPTEGYTEITC